MGKPVALDYAQVSRALPHGRAMVLVDRVESMELGVSIVGIKAITGTELCYQDVPDGVALDRCAYPVSLLLESFGQTAALLWLRSNSVRCEDANRVLMFVSARNLKIEGSAFPGDVLSHRAHLEKALDDTVFVSGETWVEDRRIMSVGSMIAVVRPLSQVLDNASAGARQMRVGLTQDEVLSSFDKI
jgi:3-hydroxyacyl-[acyl-carrier-protein] dehydratase